jgi:predicted nucleotidyltransferase
MNDNRNALSELFRTSERITLLRAVLNQPACTVQQVAGKTGISKGLVSKYLAMLEYQDLLSRQDRVYHLNTTARTSAIKRLLNVDLVLCVLNKPAWASGIGMYGSWAEGTNTEESDIDLWISTETLPSGILVAELERDISHKISTEVHVLVLTPGKIAGMKRSDEPFYRSFVKQSITLEGDSPDTD